MSTHLNNEKKTTIQLQKIDSLLLPKAESGSSSSAENANLKINCRRNDKEQLLPTSIICHGKVPS
jgi:hypothetical protein